MSDTVPVIHQISIYVGGKVKWQAIFSGPPKGGPDTIRDAALAKFSEVYPELEPEKVVINGKEVELV